MKINVECYLNKGLKILPVKGKRPYIEDWYNVDFDLDHSYEGVGLKCGEASGIICLDFDSQSDSIKDKIKELLPPIFSGKVGNPNKLPTMFFKFNGEISRDLRNIEVQLLSTGKQTVLPPTIHPTLGTPFVWAGFSLLEVDLDDLPDLESDVWESLVKLNDETSSWGDVNSAIGVGIETKGRNNNLKAQVTAAVVNGKGIDEVVKEVLEYDKANHIPPLFEDKSEPTMRGANPYTNALGFVCRIVSSLARNPSIKLEQPEPPLVINFTSINSVPEVSINNPERVATKRNFLKLPKLVGLGDAIFHELYDGAPIPRTQYAFQNTMFLLSLLAGNKFTFRGTGVNLYTYSVGISAAGKDYPFKRTQQIIKLAGLEHLIGPSSPTSESSILKFLEENREKGCWWNEGEKVLKTMANPRMNFGALECVTDLYDGVGKYYFNKGTLNASGQLQKFGDIYSPFLCITMASTLAAFNACANASMFETGLLNRFDIYFEDRYKKLEYKENFNSPVNQALVKRINSIAKPLAIINDSKTAFDIFNLKETDASKKMSRAIFDIIDHDNEKFRGGKFEGLMARKLLRANKYAAIHHFMSYEQDFLRTPIDAKSIQWGYECANSVMHNMMQMLPSEVSENQNERSYNTILNKIRKLHEQGKPITKTSIANNMQQINVNERNAILRDMIDRGVLKPMPDKTFVLQNLMD